MENEGLHFRIHGCPPTSFGEGHVIGPRPRWRLATCCSAHDNEMVSGGGWGRSGNASAWGWGGARVRYQCAEVRLLGPARRLQEARETALPRVNCGEDLIVNDSSTSSRCPETLNITTSPCSAYRLPVYSLLALACASGRIVCILLNHEHLVANGLDGEE